MSNNILAKGSFLQWDMAEGWDDERFKKEFEALKEIGMNYLILQNVSLTKNDDTYTIFDATEYGFKKYETKNDIIELCLKNAEIYGFYVFFGIQFNEDWWKDNYKNEAWLISQMEIGNKVCYSLFNKYYNRYKNSFYGWYFVYEVDNIRFCMPYHFEALSKAFKYQSDFMENQGIRLPFLISPFINTRIYQKDAEKIYANGFSIFFEKSGFKSGDIFCPQDSIGAKGLSINEIDKWYSAFINVIPKEKGILFWSNAETFELENLNSATIDRFALQLNIEGKYAENIITFSYCHYYSPNNINTGFHNSYLNYVKTGSLRKILPSSPQNIKIKKISKNKVEISWDSAYSPLGICGYKLLRNNTEIFKTQYQRIYGGGNLKEPLLKFEDTLPFYMPFFLCKYKVIAFDFEGNMST